MDLVDRSAATIMKRYLAGESCLSIGESIGLAENTVYQRLKKQKAKLVPGKSTIKQRIPDAKIIRMYQSGISANKIANRICLHRSTIEVILKRNNVTVRGQKIKHRLDIDTDEIVRRYVAGESSVALSQAFNCTDRVIAWRLRNAGVKLRTLSEARRLRYKREKSSGRVFTGWNTPQLKTPEAKEKRELNIAKEREQNAHKFFRSPAVDVAIRIFRTEGLDFRLKRAIGKYNVDIAVGTVAIIILDYRPHTNLSKKVHDLMAMGWTVICIKVSLVSPKADAIKAIRSAVKTINHTITSQAQVPTFYIFDLKGNIIRMGTINEANFSDNLFHLES